MKPLDGRVAIVTGASQGIGRGIALALAEAGASIVAAGRTPATLAAVCIEIEARGVTWLVSDEASYLTGSTIMLDGGQIMDESRGIRIARERFGVENLLWASDYPHPPTTWPNSRARLDAQLNGLPDDERALISGGNVARVWQLA